MIRTCPVCGGHVLTATMTATEEATFAAAFVCTACKKRILEAWPKPAARTKTRAIEER
ncbi:MAG: hypothetical protein HYV09_01420 [Deltaproteobacteria bacterium]|nr:hypothetical protein [Deltaproteobacteria bacterium]